jgi:hypothetical protein
MDKYTCIFYGFCRFFYESVVHQFGARELLNSFFMGFHAQYSIYDQVCEHVRECPDATGCIPGVNDFVIVLYEYIGSKLGSSIWCLRFTDCYADEL